METGRICPGMFRLFVPRFGPQRTRIMRLRHASSRDNILTRLQIRTGKTCTRLKSFAAGPAASAATKGNNGSSNNRQPASSSSDKKVDLTSLYTSISRNEKHKKSQERVFHQLRTIVTYILSSLTSLPRTSSSLSSLPLRRNAMRKSTSRPLAATSQKMLPKLPHRANKTHRRNPNHNHHPMAPTTPPTASELSARARSLSRARETRK